jgi:ribosomal protein S11
MDILQEGSEHIQMEKQKKNINFRAVLRYRRLFRNNISSINPIYHIIRPKLKLTLTFNVTQNNIFCTLINNKNNILFVTSSGKEKIATSKKTLKYSARNITISFLKKIKRYFRKIIFLIKIKAPLRIKINLLRILGKIIDKKYTFIYIKNNKCFNGCKPPKKKRKKRHGLRIFK